jgi:hypothetical protein
MPGGGTPTGGPGGPGGPLMAAPLALMYVPQFAQKRSPAMLRRPQTWQVTNPGSIGRPSSYLAESRTTADLVMLRDGAQQASPALR